MSAIVIYKGRNNQTEFYVAYSYCEKACDADFSIKDSGEIKHLKLIPESLGCFSYSVVSGIASKLKPAYMVTMDKPICEATYIDMGADKRFFIGNEESQDLATLVEKHVGRVSTYSDGGIGVLLSMLGFNFVNKVLPMITYKGEFGGKEYYSLWTDTGRIAVKYGSSVDDCLSCLTDKRVMIKNPTDIKPRGTVVIHAVYLGNIGGRDTPVVLLARWVEGKKIIGSKGLLYSMNATVENIAIQADSLQRRCAGSGYNVIKDVDTSMLSKNYKMTCTKVIAFTSGDPGKERVSLYSGETMEPILCCMYNPSAKDVHNECVKRTTFRELVWAVDPICNLIVSPEKGGENSLVAKYHARDCVTGEIFLDDSTAFGCEYEACRVGAAIKGTIQPKTVVATVVAPVKMKLDINPQKIPSLLAVNEVPEIYKEEDPLGVSLLPLSVAHARKGKDKKIQCLKCGNRYSIKDNEFPTGEDDVTWTQCPSCSSVMDIPVGDLTDDEEVVDDLDIDSVVEYIFESMCYTKEELLESVANYIDMNELRGKEVRGIHYFKKSGAVTVDTARIRSRNKKAELNGGQA